MRMMRSDALPNASRNLQAEAKVGATEFSGVPAYNPWMGYGAMITLIPLLVVGFYARMVMKQNYLTLCGLLAGSSTDPPALAFANSLAPSEAQPLAYATIYPWVMCLRILAPQILVMILAGFAA